MEENLKYSGNWHSSAPAFHFYFQVYQKNKELAIIYDFTATWMGKYKHIMIILKFNETPESFMTRSFILTE